MPSWMHSSKITGQNHGANRTLIGRAQGLDPASRRALWEVVRAAKRDRAVVLTTHSMAEAEVLCDRLGIFVDGRLVCVGDPKQITARHGGYLVRR
jgi:ABC-type multidrug transport system ATPase subunit